MFALFWTCFTHTLAIAGGVGLALLLLAVVWLLICALFN